MEIFRSMLHVILPFSTFFLTEFCSFRYCLKDRFTLHKLAAKVSLTSKMMTSQAIEEAWIRTGGYRRLRAARGRMGKYGK